MRRITVAERRARLARRHHLAATARTDDVATAAADLVGLHATDPATVFLAATARMRRSSVEPLEQALYDHRTLVRTLAMRRTMWVVPVELVPVVQAACTDGLVAGERRRTLALLEANDLPDAAGVLRALEDATVEALEQHGEATGAELAKLVPGLDRKLAVGQGRKWEGTVGVSTRVLTLLSTEQRAVRGRPRGTWISSQYRWSPMSAWLPERGPAIGADEARIELVRRWLHAFGPATVADLKWWTGLALGPVRRALAAIPVEEVDLDGVRGVVLADDLAPVRRPKPWAALLPSLDPTTMGWREREWYLGPHGPVLFDGNGNPGPTIWWDGRIVGGWGQRPDGEVVVRLLEDVGSEAAAAVDAEADRLTAWLAPVRVSPRFPTPLQRELMG